MIALCEKQMFFEFALPGIHERNSGDLIHQRVILCNESVDPVHKTALSDSFIDLTAH